MKLVPYTDEILKSVCHEFDFASPPFDPTQFAVDLVKCMYDHNGIGLSANQVGVPYRVFAMRASPENLVCFNPRLVTPGDEQIVLEEGCLSYPGLFVKVKRPRHIRVRFQLPNGDTRTEQFTGMTARCFLHELDHLDGQVFYQKASKHHKNSALNKWKSFKRRAKAADVVGTRTRAT